MLRSPLRKRYSGACTKQDLEGVQARILVCVLLELDLELDLATSRDLPLVLITDPAGDRGRRDSNIRIEEMLTGPTTCSRTLLVSIVSI